MHVLVQLETWTGAAPSLAPIVVSGVRRCMHSALRRSQAGPAAASRSGLPGLICMKPNAATNDTGFYPKGFIHI